MNIPKYLITFLNFILFISFLRNMFLGFFPLLYHGRNIRADFFLLSFILFFLHHSVMVQMDSSSPLTVSATRIMSSAKARTTTPQISFSSMMRSLIYALKSMQEVEYP